MESAIALATILLAVTVLAVPAARRAGLGSVLGYLFAGIFVGQVVGVFGQGAHEIREFAEFGIVMLLFVIGLEMKPRTLWDMRDKLIGLGGLQVVLTAVAIATAGVIWGLTWTTALAIGMTLALSSTAMVLQTLSEKGLTQTNGGRSTVSVLLTQDIAVLPMLVILPFLAAGSTIHDSGDARIATHGESAEQAWAIIEHLPGWGVAGVMLASILFIIIGGHFLVQPLFRYVASARLTEISTAATLLLVVGTALLMNLVGLSPALGTFLAGVVLANSEFRHEMESSIEPFKGLLLGLFFLMVGATMDFLILIENAFAVMAITIGIIAIKLGVLFLLAMIFAIKGRDRWLFSLGLAQAGEFSLVLVNYMAQISVVGERESEILLLSVAFSMILTPALFIAYDYLARRMGDAIARAPQDDDDVTHQGPIIIAGIGRFGQLVNQFVTSNGFRTTVLDADIQAIMRLRRLGIKAYLGDPSRPELLQAAGLDTAEALLVAIDDPKIATEIVRFARRRRGDLYIIARAYDRLHAFALYDAGATSIIRETFDSSLRAGRYILQRMGISEDEAHQRTRDFYQFERNATQELALVWDPDIPIEKNEAYIARLQELKNELQLGVARANATVADIDSDMITQGGQDQHNESTAKTDKDPTQAPPKNLS
ncbi:MAG: cation:proton antiporter [Rhodobacteraceae bacterium]|nr:cation:proton antiporter [Paracoccaceae bacterium]